MNAGHNLYIRLLKDANVFEDAALRLRSYQAGDGKPSWLHRKALAFVIGFLNAKANALRHEAMDIRPI